jgi:hypothetical protein
MAYTIYNADGTTLLLLADDTVDQSATSLNLVGKNVNGYGQYMNNNFIKLLANSASTAKPRSPLTGQLWFDTTSRRLNVYQDRAFKPVTGANVIANEPSAPADGDLWFNSGQGERQLRVYSRGDWFLVGPAFPASYGENGWVPTTVIEGSNPTEVGNAKPVTLLKNRGVVLGIISTSSYDVIRNESPQKNIILPISTSTPTAIVNGLTLFGSMRISNTATTTSTNSISTTTGALVIVGGVGIGQDLYVGGKIVANELDIQYTTVTTTLVVTDDVISTYNTTSAYSTNTGALIVGGGIGVGKGIYVGAAVTATTIVATHSTTTNAVITNLTATNVLITNFTATNALITKLTATNVLVTTITATNSLVTNFTATNSTLTNVVIGAALNMGTNKITNMADPAADTDAVTRQFLYGRNIVLSMDVSDGISNANIITYLAQIAPVAEYKNGTNARILCSTVTLSSGTVSLSTTNGTFLITTSTTGSALTGATASATAPTVSVSRVVKTFAISGGAWTFVS